MAKRRTSKKVPADTAMTAKVRKLSKLGKIEFAPSHEAEEYDNEVAEVLARVFEQECYLVTDLSEMMDFTRSSDKDRGAWRYRAVELLHVPLPDADALVVDVAKALRQVKIKARIGIV